MENPDHCFQPSSAHQFTPEKPKSDHFLIEDLLDFPTDEMVTVDDPFVADDVLAITDSATLVVDSCNSSHCGGAADHNISGDVIARRSFTDTQFSNDLCVPYDDVAEIEWLSNVVEESFSCEDLQKRQIISGIKARPAYAPDNHQFQPDPTNQANPMFNSDMLVSGKARTKRSRAAPCKWTSQLVVSPTNTRGPTTITMSSESESDIASSLTRKNKTVKAPSKKKEVYDNQSHNGEGRKCLHCATDKTPQWRSGPMGPKTLCNACGVRYKSGRLVPEYRPAASPTFILAKHSNSHRKVLELRRQKDVQRAQQQQQQQQYLHHQTMMFDLLNNDDYLIHQHIGTDYRQLI